MHTRTKYLVRSRQGWPIACLAWSSASRHLGCRDRFIGWPPEVRRKNLHCCPARRTGLLGKQIVVDHATAGLFLCRRCIKSIQQQG